MVLVQRVERLVFAYSEIKGSRVHRCSAGGQKPGGDQVRLLTES